jgi:hypothetical protein
LTSGVVLDWLAQQHSVGQAHRGILTNHGIGSEDTYINEEGIGAYRPNAVGYVAYAAAISAELPSAWLHKGSKA